MAIVITPPDCHHFSFHFRSLTHWTYIGRTIRQTVSAFSAPGTWSPWKLEGREDGALEVICSKIKDLVKEECQLSKKRPRAPGSPPGAALKSRMPRTDDHGEGVPMALGKRGGITLGDAGEGSSSDAKKPKQDFTSASASGGSRRVVSTSAGGGAGHGVAGAGASSMDSHQVRFGHI